MTVVANFVLIQDHGSTLPTKDGPEAEFPFFDAPGACVEQHRGQGDPATRRRLSEGHLHIQRCRQQEVLLGPAGGGHMAVRSMRKQGAIVLIAIRPLQRPA